MYSDCSFLERWDKLSFIFDYPNLNTMPYAYQVLKTFSEVEDGDLFRGQDRTKDVKRRDVTFIEYLLVNYVTMRMN